MYILVENINYLFSPDLMYYFEYDKLIQEYRINSTLRNHDRKKLNIIRQIHVDNEDKVFKQRDYIILEGIADIDDTNFEFKRYFYNFRWDDKD